MSFSIQPPLLAGTGLEASRGGLREVAVLAAPVVLLQVSATAMMV